MWVGGPRNIFSIQSNKIKTQTKIKTQACAEHHIVQSRIGYVMIRENSGRDVVMNFRGDKLASDQNCLGGVTGDKDLPS